MTTTHASDVAALYTARRGTVALVEVPELLYCAVDGHGAPGDAAFAEAVRGVYTIAYGVRFARRDAGEDEKVSALEALWTSPDPAGDFAAAVSAGGFSAADMARWSWRVLLRLPDGAEDLLEAVRAEAVRRHPEVAPTVAAVRIERWREGLAVQTLHVGPYADELPTVRLLHDFIAAHGYVPAGPHHEIYLGDPRRTAPERLRTILRQPVQPR
ncbi:MAG TPA: GyrI-like domain-containing protein [Solirubrobacterales bacterium]|nr:GyrI-like domain-containing protein [Solirubrobacterales bacterium]